MRESHHDVASPQLNASTGGVPSSAPATRSVRQLDRAECHALLRDLGWGILSTVEVTTARPYAVPVAYAIDGETIYVATGPGRKLRVLELNPGLCLTLVHVERLDRWRSVVIIGLAQWLVDLSCRMAAVRAFMSHPRLGSRWPTVRDAERLLHARIFRIDVAEMSGRACGGIEAAPGR